MEQVSYDDKVVISPVELYRDRELCGECYAVFAVMKSFGPFAMAKVETYGSRLNWHKDRVQKYQAMLQKAGWIVLVREGYDGNPRLWWMARVKGEQPPQDLVDRVGKKQGVQNTPPVKSTPSKKQGVQNTPPKQKKALQSVEDLDNQKKREKGPLSAATPSTSQALQLLSGLCEAKHGPQARLTDQAQADRALALYGDDLQRSYRAFLADPGTRGRMDQLRHPLSIFNAQVDIWRTPVPAAVDPAKAAARAHEAQARKQQDQTRLEAETAREQSLVTRWKDLSKATRLQVMNQVSDMSDFMADLVKACLQKQGGVFKPGSAICSAVLELRPDLVEAQHA